MLNDEIIANLRSLEPADLARTLREWGFVYEGDPQLDEFLARARVGNHEDGKIIEGIIGRRKRQPGEAYKDFRVRSRLNWLAERKPEWFAPTAQNEEPPEEEHSAPLQSHGQENADQASVSKQGLAVSAMPDPGLAAYLFEHGRELWSHLVGPLPFKPPPGYRPRRPMVNPFWPAPPKMKGSALTGKDVRRVYNAIAYAMWQGVILNTHLIIVWSMMNLSEESGVETLGAYLHEAGKWLRSEGAPRGKKSARSVRTKTDLRYVYVHEKIAQRGFHSHILIHLPPALKKEFEAWSRSALSRLTGRNYDRNAFRVILGYGRFEEDQVRNVWRWYRYLMKSVEPRLGLGWTDEKGVYQERTYRQLLKVWNVKGTALDVPEGISLSKASHNIGNNAQKLDGFVARLQRNDWDELYAGRELDEGRQHREYLQRMAEEEELIRTLQI
ncbi:hypothetical protein FXV83_05320 [Bradyrhizobium hipponense]|uniref:Uncharacterized protein n=1 Tax=Bradyrhizobium hipponense TaxID=2605638 RepID=A0A5S4YU35_9BRAD|nr:hypothetical protein [Bradyrhizobium hipponense]TYO67402.1 hypothetical protein FXV83_05320 [Bradyrhizobium hipponense]